ncbi:hypothetical protein SLEP1_g43714 [Rubroshorea leprosula]|uniref:Uncharacterized protein n=1 Tax=Rubroshorea leprosula TaxID=152421 RepID=A0AAV5LDV9_9ROSI|nr:hypothetical protein SLEP1_g43714 [Rubroshorea leprosula]
MQTEEGLLAQPLGQGQSQPPNNLPLHLPPPILNLFPSVDRAEGGDENQPHNSAHNLTSIANQDIVTAQLAAMQQQFGVFQLVLAQLLARNNPGDPLINLLNPTQQPPVQSHVAPAQQPLLDDVTRRLDSLEKLVAEQRGAPPPHHNTDFIRHPLNINIKLEPYPISFKIPQLETYDGTKDLDDHLHAFYSCMQAQNAFDALMCKIFPSTLCDNARTWYYSLPLRPISSYSEMASAFATKFSSRRLIRKTTSELMRVKQKEGESLKNYMSQFNDAVLEVSSFNQAVGIAIVIQGLQHERFRDSLIKHPAATFNEVNDRSLKFITAEEYALSQKPVLPKSQNPDWRDEGQSRKRMKTMQNRVPMSTFAVRFRKSNSLPPQQSISKAPVTWTPFNLSRYCDFHQDHGHTTEQCNSLRFELESLAQKGMLNEYIQRSEQPKFVREQGPQSQRSRNARNSQGMGYQQAPPPLPPPTRIIHTITEGLEARDLSSKQRKLYFREVKHQNRAQKRKFDDVDWKNQPITFTSVDFDTVVTPHNDPLVTSIMINNCEQTCQGSQPQYLNTNLLKKPVAQKQRLFGGERLQVIKEEVEKLLQAGFVKRVDYCEWVANPVPMASKDEEKTSFYASNEIYYHVMMPFGLKNASATYQKMVTIVFRTQIGRNLKVYVDDIVLKSLKAEDHLADLDETFHNLRKNKMRLNPAKCIFGVESKKFLGFMVSRRGIEVNPEKIRAIAEMEPLKSVKDIQRLTRRVAALHRFISKSVDKCLPFFKIMRLAVQKDESSKQKKFKWNQECQAAFDELKSYLSSPPLLTKAINGEILYLYLGISDEAISSVLVREEGKQQKPIYYISSMLHGAELRYPIVEKATLAVVTSARKLRPFFQSHPIIVLIDQPLQ